jgi:predicted dehydrogenase
MTRQLGIAVIGLGIGEQHARMYATLPSCRVKLLVDLDRSRAENLARAFPGSDAANDLDYVLGRDDIDVVSIASFDDAHFDQVMRSLSAGKHVFVEKPLCRTAEELAQIRAALNAKSSLHLASNLVLRGADLYRWLRGEIAAGAFGDIYSFDGDYLYGRLHKITEGWRGDTEDYSVMLGGGVHMIDLMLWLTGQRPLSVQAVGNRICTRNTGFQYDDFTAATMTFASRMVGRITANFGCVHRHQHVVRIFGTRKTFILDDAGPRLMTARDPAEPGLAVAPVEPINLATKPAHKGALIPAFVEGIVLNKPPRTTDVDATLDAIAIAAACDQSVASSSSVQIRYQ